MPRVSENDRYPDEVNHDPLDRNYSSLIAAHRSYITTPSRSCVYVRGIPRRSSTLTPEIRILDRDPNRFPGRVGKGSQESTGDREGESRTRLDSIIYLDGCC